MKASLPTQLQTLSLYKVMHYTPPVPVDDARRVVGNNNILPLPRVNRQSGESPPLTIEEQEKMIRIPFHLLDPPPGKRNQQTSMAHNKQYDCLFCQKKFMRPSSLKIHTYTHTGEKPFKCSFPGCKRKFSVQSNMRRHLRVHSN
ncbi:hypothetical protein BD770DRAFT_383053 [Pilaira anomala]|nr:hypothetical protein BD770DRAFT_383053 [Pilaira anomala]